MLEAEAVKRVEGGEEDAARFAELDRRGGCEVDEGGRKGVERDGLSGKVVFDRLDAEQDGLECADLRARLDGVLERRRDEPVCGEERFGEAGCVLAGREDAGSEDVMQAGEGGFEGCGRFQTKGRDRLRLSDGGRDALGEVVPAPVAVAAGTAGDESEVRGGELPAASIDEAGAKDGEDVAESPAA
ncbi:MAG: hypothetical protein ACSLFM_07620 [Tepidiformaceae bacterium]